MKIDVHAHCYPKSYVQELAKLGIGDEGGVGVSLPVWTTAEERILQMDDLGVDVQVLSISAPNVYFPDRALSRALAEMTNDFLAQIVRRYPDRFLALASIPLISLDDAVEELSRAIDGLQMDGLMLGTNVNKRALSDERFLPFFEEVNRRQVPVVLHPIKSAIEDLMPQVDRSLCIPSNVGFVCETTRTAAQMTFMGTFERLKNLVFVLPHSGGAIPFVAPRWDLCYRSREDDHPLRRLPHCPSYYLRRHYYDTALSYAHSSLRCTLDFVGADHVVFGTDHPYTSDFRAQETIEGIDDYGGLGVAEKESIYCRNAANIFPRLRDRLSS